MTDNNIIQVYKYTGGDQISHYEAKFVENPTLEEFVSWILANRAYEYGVIHEKGSWAKVYVEYRDGKVAEFCDNYSEIKDKKISLNSMDGGWSLMDYSIDIIK